jgi:hypothetical protein
MSSTVSSWPNPPTAPKRDRTILLVSCTVDGAKILKYGCAVWHGTYGRENGPDSTVLKHPVPDSSVYGESLRGRTRIVLPGRSRDVSSGPIFLAVESDQDWGGVRLDAITEHTESMQH